MIYVFIILMVFLSFFYLSHPLKNQPSEKRKKWIFVFIAIPLFSVGLYFLKGRPDYLDQPYDALKAQNEALRRLPTDELIIKLRQKLDDTDSETARLFLGETLAKLGRFEEALPELKRAYILSKGKNPDISMAYAEMLIATHKGQVSLEAKKLLDSILKQDKKNPRALFYMGLYYFQKNTSHKGAELWKELLKISHNRPWHDTAVDNIRRSAELEKINLAQYGINLPEKSVPNFTPEQIEMITQMVKNLRFKVKNNPDDKALRQRLTEVEKVFSQIKKD